MERIQVRLRKAHKLDKRITFAGMDVSVETQKGAYRHWGDRDGSSGKTLMLYDYGYVRGSLGTDGDHVDVYVGPDEFAPSVYVISQMTVNRWDTFDEQKCMLGFRTAREAKRAYMAHYNDPRFFGSMKEMPIGEFRDFIQQKANHGKVIKSGAIYYGKRGGKYSDPQHKVPWQDGGREQVSLREQQKLQKKIKRRAPGEGGEVALNRRELTMLLNSGRFALVSAGPNPAIPEDADMSKAQQASRHQSLRSDLVAGGFMHTQVAGRYGEREDTFLVMVHDAKRDEVRSMGSKYKQDSVIYGENGKFEAHYTHGPSQGLMDKGKGWSTKNKAGDFYTQMDHPDGTRTKFILGINFGKHVERTEKSMQPIRVRLVKAAPGGGWGPIPGGKRGGFRKRKGRKWEYWYAKDHPGESYPPGHAKAGKHKPYSTSGRTSGDHMPSFADSTAKVGTVTHGIENGLFQWKRSRRYTIDADGKQIRSTKVTPHLSDTDSMGMVNEYGGMIENLAKKALKRFALKSAYSLTSKGAKDETLEDLRRSGVEGILESVEAYDPKKGPFASHAKAYAGDYMARGAASLNLNVSLPVRHEKNLTRYIAARVRARQALGVDNPSPTQVLPFFDLKKKHLHQDMISGGGDQVPSNEVYELLEGAKAVAKTRRGKPKEITRSVAQQPSKLTWATMYHDFLDRGEAIGVDDESIALPGAKSGYGMSPEDQSLVRDQVTRALNAISDLGSHEITKEAKKGTGKYSREATRYRIADLGAVVHDHIVVSKSLDMIVKENPILKQRVSGEWKPVAVRSATNLMQDFLSEGMAKLQESTKGMRSESVVNSARDRVAPKRVIPHGPTFGELITQEAKKVTKTQVAAFREQHPSKGATDNEVRRTLARRSRIARGASKQMHKLMTHYAEVERISDTEGVMTTHDPTTGRWDSARVRMNRPVNEDFEKSGYPYDALTDSMIMEVQRYPLQMRLLLGDDGPSTQRTGFERVLGVS
jgi:DNA-directed RNA polymerase specialized sigma subunit